MPKQTQSTLTMPDTLVFISTDEYRSCKIDVDFWRLSINEVLSRHGLTSAGEGMEVGFNATYPVFLIGDVVIKFFGHTPNWQEAYAAECAAYDRLALDDAICVPKVLAKGRLFPGFDAPWPYMITTRMSGISWLKSNPSPQQQLTIASELGEQIRRVHLLPTNKISHDEGWSTLNVTEAVKKSSLPHHLIAQVESYLTQLDPFDEVFVHGDLVANHVYIHNEHLVGIIDWGDAMVADRHYEIGKLFFHVFDGNKALLRTFLDAARWPVGPNFSRQVLGLTLYRQAMGLVQHYTFDIFYTLSKILPIEEILSLDELATALFEV